MSTFKRRKMLSGSASASGVSKASKRMRGRKTRAVTEETVRRVLERAAELKGCDFQLDLGYGSVIATFADNGSAYGVNLIQPGAGSFNRVGREISMKSLELRICYGARWKPTATTAILEAISLRIVVVYDEAPQGAIPNWNTVFKETEQNGNTISAFMSPLSYDNMDRFRILADEILEMNPTAIAATGTDNDVFQQYILKRYIRLNGTKTQYTQATANPLTVANITGGALYVYFRATRNDAEAGAFIHGASMARLRYVDV